MTEAPGILLVEDDPDLAECLAMVLGEAGYRTRVAASGDDAVRECRASAPSLALVDFHLPGQPSGAALVGALRAWARPGAQVIVMSAEPQVAARARECGADGSIEKPFQLADLLSLVARHLRR